MFSDSGITVTAKELPFRLTFQERNSFTLQGFTVDITTSQGTCRYSGPVDGWMEFPDLYTFGGVLNRQSDGCGLATRVGVGERVFLNAIDG